MAAKKILILAEEKFVRDLVQNYLQQVGAQILTASTGREGLALAQTQHPDLIILDALLPDLPSRELCRQLKADFKTKTIPILIMLPSDQLAETQKSREAGAAEVISKPIKPRQLLQRAAKFLGVPVRYPIHLPATVSSAGGSGVLPFKAEVLDLSETGIRITTSLKLALNSAVRVQFQLPGQAGSLSLEAKALRLESGERGEMTYGMRFSHPNSEQQARIQAYLQSLPVKISH
jgi:CheY-like chemotaxis protein